VRMVEDLVSLGVDAICVVPNDARALEPVFARARARGIKVITHESPSQREHDYNVEAIDNEAFGRYHVDKLVEFMGDTGEYVVFVGSLTAPTHNLWADVGIAYAEEQYLGLRLVTDRIPFGDDQEVARQRTLEVLRAYPELKGMSQGTWSRTRLSMGELFLQLDGARKRYGGVHALDGVDFAVYAGEVARFTCWARIRWRRGMAG
jgi:simple sugar transport system substrate-binding protein